MNKNTELELLSAVFEKYTGKIAPFKDSPAGANGPSIQMRQLAWENFMLAHGKVLRLLLNEMVNHILQTPSK